MGSLIRNKDWSETSLGSPEKWPQPLKAAVSSVINNPFPTYIAWGKDYIQIFNDSYLPILGEQGHINALGSSTCETFSEGWPLVEPIFKAVEEGQSLSFANFKFPVSREGMVLDCYFDLGYSPIFLEDGTVGGILITIFETTDKHLADEELKVSEKRFKAVADNIPNLAWMSKANGDVYWYNKQWYDYTGTTYEEMQGWGWKSVYHEEQLKQILKEWNYSLENGVPFEMIYPIKGADGIYHQFLTRALPVNDDDGLITTWFGTNTNITPQKVAEKALDDSKKELEFVIEAAGLGTFDYNPITGKFTGNERLKKWFGLPFDQEIDLKDAIKVIKTEDRGKVVKEIENALQFTSGGSYDIAYNIVNPITKDEITLHGKGKVLFDTDKKPFRFNGTVEDITAQTIARKKLEQSENNLKLIILQAPMVIAILSGPEYVVEIANQSALDLWGKSQEDVYNIPVFKSIPELEQQGVKDILKKVRITGQHFSTTELPLKIRINGSLETVFMNFSYEPILDEVQHSSKIMVLGYDVTAQVMARREIEKSEESIRSLVESAPFPIAVYTGSEMRITLANKSMIDAWGKENQVIGKLFTDLLPEFKDEEIFEEIINVHKNGIAFHAKNKRLGIVKQGVLSFYHFNYSLTPLKDSCGKIYGVMHTAAEVTELIEAKQKIEESEKRFRDAVHQAPVAMVILKGTENIVDMVNSYYLELVDKRENEFLSNPLFDCLPDIKHSIQPIITDIYKTGKPFYGYEFPVLLKKFGKKEKCYFNFVYHPLKEGDDVTAIMVVATDVTANVTAKKMLEDNEQKLNIVIEASELGVWELDLDTDRSTVSKRALEILRIPNNTEYNRQTLASKFHPDDLAIRKLAFEDALKNGLLYYEIRTIDDGVIHWVEAKGKVFFRKDGKATRILGTLRDVTEEKRVQNQLIEREQKFRLLADSMPQFVWTANPKGDLNYFNQAVFDFSGISKEDIIVKGWLSIVHDDEKEENILKWSEAISLEKDFIIEHRFRKSDGTYRWQLSRAIPQRDKDGKITMWVGTSTDIQDQKLFTTELERQVIERTKELCEKNHDLERMNKELQSFAYISSHDLQEPLRKIQTFATQLKEKEYANLSDKGKDKFLRMQSAADRMQTLIQDLLVYSRTSIQDRIFTKEKISSIVEKVKEDLEEDFDTGKTNIKIINDCEIEVIPIQFRQVIFNLISNSIKFTKPDTSAKIIIDTEIALGSALKNDDLVQDVNYCHILFKDQGIGFEPEYSDKIFVVFQRLHSKEKFEGTGIGLAIVKRIVENHKGIITAEGELDKGATFNIYIPVKV